MGTDDKNSACVKNKPAENSEVGLVPFWSLEFNDTGKAKYVRLRSKK